jgi:acetyl esterase/lipase
MSFSKESPTVRVTQKTTRSIPMLLLTSLIRPFKPALVSPGKQPIRAPGTSPQLDPQAKYDCKVSERKVAGLRIYDISPPSTASSGQTQTGGKAKRIYYFGGGGFIAPPSKEHWAFVCEIARKTADDGVHISMVSPPLAPETRAETGLEMMEDWLRVTIQDGARVGEEIILMGDSSGGNLALCCALLSGGRGVKAVVMVSPTLDLAKANPEMKEAEKLDPVQTIESSKQGANEWKGDLDGKDARISPLYADLGVLTTRGVDVHCVSGTYDILHPDVKLMRGKMEEFGVKGEWLIWEKQMHCFPLAWTYGLSEAKHGKDWILDLLRRI